MEIVSYEAKGDRHQKRIDMTVNLERLLTDLKIDSQAESQVIDDRTNTAVDEYQQLRAWLTH